MNACGGQSLIFLHDDIKELSEEEIVSLVKKSEFIGENPSTTITLNSDGYTLVNFNFWVD
jgi:hypothetical protein